MEGWATGIALNALALTASGAYALAQTLSREASPVNRRFAALLALLTTLFGVRIARWLWLDVGVLRRAEEALAAFLPLFALILAEGLLRRHAPIWMKLAVSLGALLFAVAALARPSGLGGAFAYALGGFVLLGLTSIGLMMALRDRASLAQAENDAIGVLFVGLLLALPFSATDFLAAAGLSPIRAGGLGLLFFVMAVARVTAVGGGWLGVLIDVVGTSAAAALGFGLFAFVFGMPGASDALNMAALFLAFVVTLRTILYLREQGAARSRSSLLQAFARAPTDDLDAFLDRVLAAPELRRAHLVEAAALAHYDAAALTHAFDASGVIDRRAAQAHEQLNVLFDEHEATHAILLAHAPIRLLLVNMPRLGAGADVDLQLRFLAKLAHEAARA